MLKRLLYKAKVRSHRRELLSKRRVKQFVLPSQAKSCLLLRSTRGDSDYYADKIRETYPKIKFTELWHISTGTLPPSDVNLITISKQNLAKKGYINADKALALLNEPFDWLIDLSNDNSDIAELLLLESNAKCKISWRYLGHFIADITVKDVEDRKEFVERIEELFLTLNTKVDE